MSLMNHDDDSSSDGAVIYTYLAYNAFCLLEDGDTVTVSLTYVVMSSLGSLILIFNIIGSSSD